MNLIFAQPAYLALLLFIPIIILIHFISIKITKKRTLKFANFNALSRITGLDLYSKNVTILALTCIIVVLSVLALAGTTMVITKTVSKFSFVIAIDSSQSMGANDFYPTRLDAAKNTALSFLDSLPFGTKVGILSFAGSSVIEQTVTDDKGLLRAAIININISDVGGTDIYEPVVTGVNLLVNEDTKALIILSDGQINTGSLEYAANYANRYHAIINTISIGTRQGGQTSYGLSQVDEQSLQYLAYNTGGNYSTAENSDKLAQAFQNALNQKQAVVPIDVSKYLLLIALLLFLIEYILINTRYRTFP